MIHMVMRDEFDHMLTQRAREAGAALLENERVRQVRAVEDRVMVETADRTFTGRIVAGADGARSVVAAGAGLARDMELGIGLEAEISVPGQRLVQWENLMGLDLGHMRGGYGWVFPKRDHLSVGAGSPLRQARRLKSGYQAVLKAHGLQDCPATRIRATGCRCAARGWRSSPGDACSSGMRPGWSNPVTGEGIYNAVRSARMAAPVIGQYLQGRSAGLAEYESMGGQRDNAGAPGGQGAGQGLCLVPRGWSSMWYGEATGCGMPAAGCCAAKTHTSR